MCPVTKSVPRLVLTGGHPCAPYGKENVPINDPLLPKSVDVSITASTISGVFYYTIHSNYGDGLSIGNLVSCQQVSRQAYDDAGTHRTL